MSGAAVVKLDDLPEWEGRTLGHTDWIEITQDQVNVFAELTNDHNFIHVDPERARTTPFGGTIAHGFLGLALLAPVTQRLEVSDATVSINYGLEKVRFPAPLPVGSRWRGAAEVIGVRPIEGGAEVRMKATIEIEASERPAVAAECLFRYYR